VLIGYVPEEVQIDEYYAFTGAVCEIVEFDRCVLEVKSVN
jgi:hypothetical protein